MQVSGLKIIQNALIGGTYGHMTFMYHNQFIRELFDSFEYKVEKDCKLPYEDAKFKAFIREILDEHSSDRDIVEIVGGINDN